MALASQVAANQPPLLSSPSHRLPRRTSSNVLLLLQPASAVLGGRNLRLAPAGKARRAQLDAFRRRAGVVRGEARGGDKSSAGGEEEERPYEEYEVTIEKPYGLKFSKGRDGGTYMEAIAPGDAADLTGELRSATRCSPPAPSSREDLAGQKGVHHGDRRRRRRVKAQGAASTKDGYTLQI